MLGAHAAQVRSLAGLHLPVELTARVGVGVDGDPAPCLQGQPQRPLRWVLPFRAAVDLDRNVEARARGEKRPGVELAFRPALPTAPVTVHLSTGAVPGVRRCAGC